MAPEAERGGRTDGSREGERVEINVWDGVSEFSTVSLGGRIFTSTSAPATTSSSPLTTLQPMLSYSESG